MGGQGALIPVESIERNILFLRGQRVMLDRELARLYGVGTKVFNQAVKRNARRFPEDFMFRLTWEEAQASRSQIVTLNDGPDVAPASQPAPARRGGNIKYLPLAFTEHGAIMAANVLNSERALEASVFVVRAFVRLRQAAAVQKGIAEKLAELERRLGTHDVAIREIIETIQQLAEPPPEPERPKIGFRVSETGGAYRRKKRSL